MANPTGRQPPRVALTPAVQADLDAYLNRYAGFVADDSDLLPLHRVVRRIARALDRAHPFAMVRLGDGEGGCLFATHPDFPHLAAYVAGQCLSRHFGPRDWAAADFAWAQGDVAGASRMADVVTFARRAAVFHEQMLSPVRDLRGMVGATYANIWLSQERPRLSGAVYRDGYLHRDLQPHYPGLIRGRDVVLVTSQPAGFAGHLAQGMDAARVDHLPITGQWSNGDNGPPLYPDGLPALRMALAHAAGPGRLVLVAAGLAGKGLCALAAQQGAVALDVGSMMDVWAGRPVRQYHSPDFVARHRLPGAPTGSVRP